MNEQQLAAVKQALEVLGKLWLLGDQAAVIANPAITALQSIISQEALNKKAENARELGLSYDTPLSSFARSSDEAKAEVMERVIDKATEEQKAVIGCVNHDCDKCKAVQEPVGTVQCINGITIGYLDAMQPVGTKLYTTPPAPQPVPVKTYNDGKPWPVAPKPWVGLTVDEMIEALTSVDPETKRLPVGFSRFACAIEAKLKEKNT
jgi:hypothetical protein